MSYDVESEESVEQHRHSCELFRPHQYLHDVYTTILHIQIINIHSMYMGCLPSALILNRMYIP
jgi:hypothetical protein